ncbi:MAG: hypothetical protein JNL92_05890, partial [Opitutaceae bacterium]|nr:hypothetical protein [Opitutaceae bacterium]
MKTLFLRVLAPVAAAFALAAGPAAHALPPLSSTITSPADGANLGTLSSPSNSVTLTATATPSGGGAFITSIDFRVNGVSVGVDTSAPFEATWTPTSPGSYVITAIATDSSAASNNTLTSAPVNVTVAAVRIANVISPANNSAVTQNSDIFLRSTATMSDGVVSSVEFLLNGSSVGVVSAAPYNFAATITAAPGVYPLIARATGSNGAIFESPPISLNVAAAIPPGPTVTVVSPTPSDTIAVGTAVTVTASAVDDGFIPNTAPGGVTFYADGDPIGTTDLTAPYSVTWTPTVAKTYSLRALATDDKGNTRLSPAVSIIVRSSAPTVSLTSPPTTVAAGTTVTLNATAAAGVGATVANVQFFADGAAIGGPDSVAPYSTSWTPATGGTVQLTARVTDSNGVTVTSAAASVNVTGGPAALGVSLAIVGSSSIPVGSTRAVNATVTGGNTISRVELYYNNSELVGTDTQAPYSFLFTAPLTQGNGILTARVYDVTGQEVTSSPLPVSITAAAGVAPLVALVAPTSGSFVAVGQQVVISGTATDPDGVITAVQVYVNGATTGLANGGLATVAGTTWSVVWTPSAVGVASIAAIATDSGSNSVAAPPVGVTVADSTSPALTLTLSPRTAAAAGSTTLPSGAVRNVLADAIPSSGRAIVRVEFFVDGTKVGEDTVTPYTFRFVAPTLAAGESSRTFVFSARATDNAGAARDVQVPLLVVSPVGSPPLVNLLTPANNAAVTPNTTVSLAATATAAGGSVSSVQFYVNGSPTSVNGGNAITAAPYTSTFVPTAPGTYTIDAIATDDRGNTTVSNSATITAAFATPTVAIVSPNPN